MELGVACGFQIFFKPFGNVNFINLCLSITSPASEMKIQ